MDKNQKEDLKPIKSILKNPTSRTIKKGLQPKTKKPSWWVRSRRAKLVGQIKETLLSYGVKEAWAHNHFLSGEEKKADNITLYVSMQGISSMTIEQLEEKIDSHFKKRKITLLDVASLMPSIKEFVFKDVTPLF